MLLEAFAKINAMPFQMVLLLESTKHILLLLCWASQHNRIRPLHLPTIFCWKISTDTKLENVVKYFLMEPSEMNFSDWF